MDANRDTPFPIGISNPAKRWPKISHVRMVPKPLAVIPLPSAAPPALSSSSITKDGFQTRRFSTVVRHSTDIAASSKSWLPPKAKEGVPLSTFCYVNGVPFATVLWSERCHPPPPPAAVVVGGSSSLNKKRPREEDSDFDHVDEGCASAADVYVLDVGLPVGSQLSTDGIERGGAGGRGSLPLSATAVLLRDEVTRRFCPVVLGWIKSNRCRYAVVENGKKYEWTHLQVAPIGI